MKKLLLIVLSFVLLFSLWAPSVGAASENYCELFAHTEFTMWCCGRSGDILNSDLRSVMAYISCLIRDDAYIIEEESIGGYTFYHYAIPADIFEAAAVDSFPDVDIQAMRTYDGNGSSSYQPDLDVYLFGHFKYTLMGPYCLSVVGYTEDEGLYTVYYVWDESLYQGGISYYKRMVKICNGRVQFNTELMSIDSIPDVEMVKPIETIKQTETVCIEAETDVFPANTVVEVLEPNADTLETMKDTLSDLASDFVAYDINATAQPNGVVRVTFDIPDGYDTNKVAVFYISPEGIAQQLKTVVDVEAGTIVAELTHFSLYAVAQLGKAEVTPIPTPTPTRTPTRTPTPTPTRTPFESPNPVVTAPLEATAEGAPSMQIEATSSKVSTPTLPNQTESAEEFVANENNGSYDWIFLLCGVFVVILLSIFFFLKLKHRRK